MPSERLARLEEQSATTNKMVTDLHSHIVGKPGAEGLVTRLAKVEQKQSTLMRIVSTIGTALVGFCIWVFQSK